MSNGTDDKKMRLEFQCDKDVRKAIEALQDTFDSCQQHHGITLGDIEAISGIDKSSLSKIVNGRKPNLTLMTIARIARSMDQKMLVAFQAVDEAVAAKPNYVCYPELDSAWTMRVRPSMNSVGFDLYGDELPETKTASKRASKPRFTPSELLGAS